jgi:hypothetical protein
LIKPGTSKEIDRIVAKTIRDAGLNEPPILIEDLLEFLQLHRDFYDLEDPGLIARVRHKIRIGGRKLVDIARKISLSALWLPDRDKILIDSSLPPPKQEWASFHDAVHTVLPWHRAYFLGDTAQTLDPDFQEKLEEEANYGASALMFGGGIFTQEALDTVPCWKSIQALKKRHRKSLVTTLRRYVQFSHELPMAMMISTPWWEEKPDDQEERWRHYKGSGRFDVQFGCVMPEIVLAEVDTNTNRRVGGPVGEYYLNLVDVNGDLHEFYAESFYNQHYVLTLIVHQRQLN